MQQAGEVVCLQFCTLKFDFVDSKVVDGSSMVERKVDEKER